MSFLKCQNDVVEVVQNYQHCCPQIKFVKELCNENVHLEHICHILSLYVAQYVDKPFKMPVRWTYP